MALCLASYVNSFKFDVALQVCNGPIGASFCLPVEETVLGGGQGGIGAHFFQCLSLSADGLHPPVLFGFLAFAVPFLEPCPFLRPLALCASAFLALPRLFPTNGLALITPSSISCLMSSFERRLSRHPGNLDLSRFCGCPRFYLPCVIVCLQQVSSGSKLSLQVPLSLDSSPVENSKA